MATPVMTMCLVVKFQALEQKSWDVTGEITSPLLLVFPQAMLLVPLPLSPLSPERRRELPTREMTASVAWSSSIKSL